MNRKKSNTIEAAVWPCLPSCSLASSSVSYLRQLSDIAISACTKYSMVLIVH